MQTQQSGVDSRPVLVGCRNVGSHDAENKAIVKDAMQLGDFVLEKRWRMKSDVVSRVLR